MAKELITRVTCDSWIHDEEPVPGDEVRVALADGKLQALDLCEACRKEVYEPLRELLEDRGQPLLGDAQPRKAKKAKQRRGWTPPPPAAVPPTLDIPRPSRAFGVYVCPVPGCEEPGTGHAKVYSNRSALGNHAKLNHGLSMVELEETYGELVGDGDPALVGEQCHVCGRSFSTLQGLNMHMTRTGH